MLACLRFSEGRKRRIRTQKGGRLPCERLVELKQRTVAGVRIGEQHSVGQVLTQPIGVAYRDHFVAYAVDDEGWLLDTSQIREAVAGDVPPRAKCGDLCRGHRWRGFSIQIDATLLESSDKGFARGLTRCARSEKEFLKTRVALQHRILEVPGQRWLFQVHDVFAAPRSSADQH